MKRQDLRESYRFVSWFRVVSIFFLIVFLGVGQSFGFQTISMDSSEPGPITPPSSMISYAPPNNVIMTLTPKDPRTTVPPMTLVGTIEGTTGTPSQVIVFFESSADLEVTPASAGRAILTQQKPATFQIVVKPGTGKPDAGGTWVRMRVTYLPDYIAQAYYLRDLKKFPDPSERRRLFEVIRKNQKARERQTDAIRYFPK